MSNPPIINVADLKAPSLIKPALWIQKIEFVRELVLNNNLMVTVLSEEGSGKSTFAKMLQSELDRPSSIETYLITATPKFSLVSLIKELKLWSNITGASTLAEWVKEKNNSKVNALLIIDDAHCLSSSLIKELLQTIKLQGEGPFFHVCLIGDVSLAPVLTEFAHESFENMIHHLSLSVLNENETKTYVMQNMVPAEGTEKLITDERMTQFYQLTEGKIARINCLMTPFFSHKLEVKTQSKRWFLQGSIAASVVLMTIFAAYLWLTMGLQAPPPQIERLVSKQPMPEPIHLESSILSYDVASVRQTIEATSLHKLDMVDEDEAMIKEPTGVVDKVVVAPKVIVKSAPSSEKRIKTIIKPKVNTSAKNHYTIQIMASHRQAPLASFIKSHHLESMSKIRQIKQGGLKWYVLTIGEFKAREPASRAISKLPKDLAVYKPWVRSLDG